MTVATLTSKGQVTIPATVRKAFKLTAGSRLDFAIVADDTAIMLTKLPSLSELRGSLSANNVNIAADGMDDAISTAIAEGRGLG